MRPQREPSPSCKSPTTDGHPGARSAWDPAVTAARHESERDLRVVVAAAMPCFKHGLEYALQRSGYHVVSWTSRAAAVAGASRAVVTLESAAAWDLLARLSAKGVCVVALLPGLSPEAYVQALNMGASAVLDWHSEPQEVVLAVQAGDKRLATLPVPILRGLLMSESPRASGHLEAREVQWLYALTRGATVASVAAGANYSEREMFRRLRRVYVVLGASSRVAAIARAVEQGLLPRLDDSSMVDRLPPA